MQTNPLTNKDLTILEDHMKAEAAANRKAALYARTTTDPQLQGMMNTLAQHHKQCYDTLYNFLNSQQ